MLKLVRVFLCVLLSMAGVLSAAEIKNQVESLQTESNGLKEVSSAVLKKDSRLVPVPIPVVNPTLGTGLAGALLYLHPNRSSDPNAPTSTTGVGGLYTDSQSWAVAAFHSGYYRDDSIRLLFPAVYGEFNVDFYGVGEDSPLRDNPIDYKAVSTAMFPRLLMELPWNNWFLGGEYAFINLDAQFDTSQTLPDIPGLAEETRTAGLGITTVYDSRNSTFWPTKGSWLDLGTTFYGDYAGGDYQYTKTIAKFAQYFPLADAVTLVYRIDGQSVAGGAPFWDLARIRLRGFAGGQYLDDAAVTAQTEVRWNVGPRWAALGFGGAGRIADSIGGLGSTKSVYAGGAGMRYMLAKKQKLSIGLDVACASDGNVSLYFQVGDWLVN